MDGPQTRDLSPARLQRPQSLGNAFTITPTGGGPAAAPGGLQGAPNPTLMALLNRGRSPHHGCSPALTAGDTPALPPPVEHPSYHGASRSPRNFSSLAPSHGVPRDAGAISPRRSVRNPPTRPVPALEMDDTADENYRHKVAQSHGALHGDGWRPNDYMIRRAEDRLAEADKRVRLLHSEAEQLDKLKRQQLAVAEEDVLAMKRKLLDDWEQRERAWEKRREEELRNLKMKEGLVDEQHQRLKEIERQQQEQMRQQEDDQRQRMRALEKQNKDILEETEQRMRRELYHDPDLRQLIEDDVTCRVAQEVREELQIEFGRLCETMRAEVQAARDRMRSELERELVPQIEQSLYLDLKARCEQEVHQRVLGQLREANQATQLLKDELQGAVAERQRAETDAANLRKEKAALEQQAHRAQELAGTAEELERTRHALAALQKEHELLQNAANVMLASAKQQQVLQHQLQLQLLDQQRQGEPQDPHISPLRQYVSDRPASTVQGVLDRDSPRDLSPFRGDAPSLGHLYTAFPQQQQQQQQPRTASPQHPRDGRYAQSQLLPGGGVML
eukprot:TRINITY_DN4894_c0_g1_i1.p1 TRINITY_DN4894_c0_g1~~TRINITY_DN4894_c0_g1_i1.p1  ORF type:complete len:606 (+),score=255.13 TRINITY_DN4894_c0_g1_i1:136-1818(+)